MMICKNQKKAKGGMGGRVCGVGMPLQFQTKKHNHRTYFTSIKNGVKAIKETKRERPSFWSFHNKKNKTKQSGYGDGYVWGGKRRVEGNGCVRDPEKKIERQRYKK